MSSKIKVDTIENVAGSGNVSLGSGHNLVVPGNITGQGTAAITSNATVGGTLGVTGATTTANITTGNTSIITAGRFISSQTSNDPWLKGVNSSNSETLFIKKDGQIYSTFGISLGGTGAANTLDDYEEGTWTPSVTVGSVGTVNGNYRKVGGIVNLRGYMANFANTTNNESMFVTGLPFTIATDTACGVAMWEYINTNFAFSVVYSAASTSHLQFFYSTDGAWDNLRHIDLDSSSSRVHFSITYHTDQ